MLALGGCKHQETRLQAEDEGESRAKEAEVKNEVKTIGDVTAVANVDPIPASGVGLVVGLEGTGGSAPPGTYRTLLEGQLAKDNVEHVKEILASPSTSLVLVSAMIPAGAHKGDPLDVEITLPPNSHTSSLRGGYLKTCVLYNYDSKKHLDPKYEGSDGNQAMLGHIIAWAEGPLLVGFGTGDESARVRQARIWGGGHSKIDRPFYLVMNSDQQRAAVAQRVADRVNETFHGPYHGSLTDIATAETSSVVLLSVPQQYKLNLPRYLRVVRLIPMVDSPAEIGPYRRRLEDQLLDPTHAVTAALRLEALGKDSVLPLKRGLQSKHALVRFCAAEALAYLGDPACGEELARLTEEQPAVRAYCLTALASIDEAISHVKLAELLSSPSAETRYGAFRALRSLDENEPAIRGEQFNDSFWLHRVVPNAPPLVHLSSSRRAEIVVFGEDPALVPPFSILAGEFTVTAAPNDERCTISRFSVEHGTGRRQCSLKVEDVIHTMADMGALYPDVFEALRQAGTYQNCTCAVARDALPQATSVYDLAGKGSEMLETDQEILKARTEFSATPTLYDRGERRPAGHADEGTEAQEPAPKEDVGSSGSRPKSAG